MIEKQQSLPIGELVTTLPAVRTARRINTTSRVYRHLVEPVEDGRDLAFQHTVFCQTSLPYRNPGDNVRLWQ
jgi:hypothetical protein